MTNQDLQDLQRLAEKGRENRSYTRTILDFSWVGNKIIASITGSRGNIYRTRITLCNNRSYGCDCQDHHKQMGRKGPCKHVLLLARMALEQPEVLRRLDENNTRKGQLFLFDNRSLQVS